MIVAALLFVAGIYLGLGHNVFALVLSSALIFFASIILFIEISDFDMLELMLTFAYLLAHQSGYLVGAYLGYQSKDQ
jgi:hypothetical protein